MELSVFKMIEKFLREKRIKRRQVVIVLTLALLVSLATAGALKLTGVTRTRELTTVDCPVEIHEHTDGCYNEEDQLICGYADFVVHTHSLSCYYDDILTCTFPVVEVHKHTEECYLREEYLVYDQAESADEGHTHTEECYTQATLLTCDLEESDGEDGHLHTEECYTVEEELTCGLQESAPVYVSADKRYKVRETLICGKEEIVLHAHTDECFQEAVFDENGKMVALASQIPADVTIPETWTREWIPACGQLQIEEHVHGAGCLHTIVLPPDEAEEYVDTMRAEEAQANEEANSIRETWSGTKAGTDCKDIGNDDGTKTVREQLTWSVTINFPDDDAWTDFTYTDTLRQTMTAWVLQENGAKNWVDGHPIHHYQVRSQLEQELADTLRVCLAQAGLENDLTYTLAYLDQDGNEVTDDSAEVVSFEIHFRREAGQNLHGQSLTFGHTSLVDTEDFVNNAGYYIDSDFTLPGFTGTGNFYFQYTEQIADEFEKGEISVKIDWKDVKGDPMTDGLPEQVKMILKQHAFKGGIYLTEKPADPANWCELTLYIEQSAARSSNDVWIKSLNGEVLGANTVTIWIPRRSLVQVSADLPEAGTDAIDDPADGTEPDSNWSYTFDMLDVSSCELTIAVDDGSDSVILNIIGKAPTGFVPTGDSAQYGDAIILNGTDDAWSYTWEQLPLNDGNGIQYAYTVEEAELPDGYFVTVEYDGAGVFTVTNRKLMESGKITVETKWIDLEGNPLVTRPESIEIELQKKVSGTDDEWVTVENSNLTLPNENGEWTASWTDLEDGEYRVVEKALTGYVPVYTYTVYDSEGNGQTTSEYLPGNAGYVTITHVEVQAEDGEIVIVKIWENEDGTPDTSHPDSITIVIKRAKKAPDDESEPDSSEPDSSEPESSTPESSEPESSAPESSEPESSAPESSEPDSSEPESSTPESSEPDSSEPDSSEPDSSTPDSSEPDSSGPDTSEPESSEPGSSPSTGDESNLHLFIIVALISGGLLLAFALFSLVRRIARREK